MGALSFSAVGLLTFKIGRGRHRSSLSVHRVPGLMEWGDQDRVVTGYSFPSNSSLIPGERESGHRRYFELRGGLLGT